MEAEGGIVVDFVKNLCRLCFDKLPEMLSDFGVKYLFKRSQISTFLLYFLKMGLGNAILGLFLIMGHPQLGPARQTCSSKRAIRIESDRTQEDRNAPPLG